jgi:hypothetical protein
MVALILGSLARSPSARRVLRAGLTEVLHGAVGNNLNPYRPELHYVRGPGPNWREKHIAH